MLLLPDRAVQLAGPTREERCRALWARLRSWVHSAFWHWLVPFFLCWTALTIAIYSWYLLFTRV